MASHEILDRISALLHSPDDTTINTSMRLPVTLREAAALATEHLGVAPSTTAYTAQLLRSDIEAALLAAVLEAHYQEEPSDRPSLAEITLGVAEIDANPLARRPDLITKAAAEIVATHPSATPDEVLLWAEAQFVIRS
ncbi:MAG: hypothetical protein JHC63_07975 [Acidimicrobiia bacterium]|nr:hypothetical protein [Acidimicrobiia bacterium]